MINFLKYAVVGISLVLAAPAWASHVSHDDDVVEPFRGVGPIADRNLPPQAIAGSGRSLSLGDANGLRDHSWAINLPGKGRLVAERKRQRESGDGRTLNWIGSLKGAAGGLVSITQRDNLVSGFIDDGKRYWVIESAGQGLLRLYEIDTSLTPPPAPPIAPASTPTTEGSSSSTTQAAGTTVVQDVLIAYSPEVTSRYGGTAATLLAIDNHIAAVNQAYSTSNVDIQLNLVGTVELAQSQSGNMSNTLSRLKSTSDSYYNEVHTLRDELGADMVAMLSTEKLYCGIAYLNHPQNSGEDEWAFSVTSAYAGYACLPLTLGHEMGHNQGLCHNREEGGCTNPAYTYGYGYRICGNFRTIMSYSCNSETRIYNFANPSVDHAGTPTGIAHTTGSSTSSEAWRALNDSALDVASWRGCNAVAAPLAPVIMSAIAASHEQIDIELEDNSTDESGFDIERSGGGQVWTKIDSLGGNAGTGGILTYADDGLIPDTEYSYRVQANNCAGVSAFSNVDGDKTQALPAEPPVAPSTVSAVAETNGDVTVTWSTVANADYGYDIGQAFKTGRGNKWSPIEMIDSDTTSPYVHRAPGAGTFRYYVRAKNAQGPSNWSSHAQVKVGGGASTGGGGPNCAKKPDHPKCQGA